MRRSISGVRPGLALSLALLVGAYSLTVAQTNPAGRATAAPAADVAWPAAAVADPTALGFTAAGLDALDARLQQAVADQDTAGMTVILLRHGQVAYFKSFGRQSGDAPMTRDSLFRIYSMTKPITGVAMMQLYEQGRWRLDDPITKHVPEFATLKVLTRDKDGKVAVDASGAPILKAPGQPPTMRQLMSHTAGFGYGLSDGDPVNKAFRDRGVLVARSLDEMMAKIGQIPLLYEPGTKWAYSVAVDIQGYLVQKLSGQKFSEYLRQHVTGPLGMPDTAFFVAADRKPRFADVHRWDQAANKLVITPERSDRPRYDDPQRLESGGGGLVGTAHDYARFSQMLLNKGELGGRRVLKPETVLLMAQNHIGGLKLDLDLTTPKGGTDAVRFGLDFAVYSDPAAAGLPYGTGTYYWGGAAGTWFWIDPVNDLAFVGMIQNQGGNRPGGMNFRNESANLVYAALARPTSTSAAR